MRIFFSLLTILFLSQPLANAQSITDLLPPELKSEVNDSLSAVLNGLVIFGSSQALGSGTFTFDGQGSPDTELDVLKLFNDFTLGDPNRDVAPFINFGVSQAKLIDEIPPSEGTGENDFSTITTDSVGLGFGANIKITDNLKISPVFDVKYGHSENNYDYNNEFSQIFVQPFDGDVFNWDVETMSYDPAVKLIYEHDLGCGVKIVPSVRYTHIFVDSISTNSEIIDVNTSSGILSTRIKFEIDDLLSVGNQNLTLMPHVNRTDIYRDARSGLGIHYFHEVALAVLARNQQFMGLFKDVGISGGWTFGEDMSGWRIGLEAEF